MSNSAAYGGYGYGGVLSRDQTRSLFSQTMGYVALTAALFAAGACLGRGLSYGLGFVWFIGSFACLIAMNFAVRRSAQLTLVLLCGFGVLIGLAFAPVFAYYAATGPQALWSAGGATALFIAGFGAAGYATRRDLSAVARICLFALIGLIIFGVVMIFVRIPYGALIYPVTGLVIFAGLPMSGFRRLRTPKDIRPAPLLAAPVFLDILNVFLFFLRIFSRSN